MWEYFSTKNSVHTLGMGFKNLRAKLSGQIGREGGPVRLKRVYNKAIVQCSLPSEA